MTADSDEGAVTTRPESGRDTRRGRWLILLLVLPLMGGGVGLTAGVVMAYVSPRKFESRAVVQVMPMSAWADPFAGAVDPSPGSGDSSGVTIPAARAASPQFIATEFAVITSQATLERVEDRLDLAERWNLAPDQVVDVLEEMSTRSSSMSWRRKSRIWMSRSGACNGGAERTFSSSRRD